MVIDIKISRLIMVIDIKISRLIMVIDIKISRLIMVIDIKISRLIMVIDIKISWLIMVIDIKISRLTLLSTGYYINLLFYALMLCVVAQYISVLFGIALVHAIIPRCAALVDAYSVPLK